MANYKCKFTPASGGAEFEINHVMNVTWGVSREAGPNGHIGRNGHELHTISLTRMAAVPDTEGVASPDDELLVQAAKLGDRGYFNGEITWAPAGDDTNVVRTIRWERGSISDFSSTLTESGIEEDIQVTVAGVLQVNDAEFRRVNG